MMDQFKIERTIAGGMLAIFLLISAVIEFPYIYAVNGNANFAIFMAFVGSICGFLACCMMIDEKKFYVFHWASLIGILFFYYITVNDPAIQGVIHKESATGMYYFILFPMGIATDMLIGTLPEKKHGKNKK